MTDSGDKNKKRTNGKSRIISFPGADERKKREQEKDQELKNRKNMEDRWRAEYKQREGKAKVPFFGKKIHEIPIFTKSILIALTVIYAITTAIWFYDTNLYGWMIFHFGFIPAMYSGEIQWTYTALIAPFSSLVIHGSAMHLGFNLFMMLVMGIFFEKNFGTKRTILFFIVCGLMGDLAYFVFNYGTVNPVIGASGAIQGFFAIFLIFNVARMPEGISKRGHVPVMLAWIALSLVLGFIQVDVAWQAHLGGFIAGWAIFELWKRGYIKV